MYKDEFSSSQLGAVLLEQLETELTEDLKEGQVWVLLLSLLCFLCIPQCKTYAIPMSTHTILKIYL